jgi:ZIP family zinc transporter
MTPFWKSFLSSLIAGSSTGLGGFSVKFINTSSKSPHVSICLGFSAGVMITISIFDLLLPIFYKALHSGNPFSSLFFCFLWFFIGVGAEVCLSKLLPDESAIGEHLLPFSSNSNSKANKQKNSNAITNSSGGEASIYAVSGSSGGSTTKNRRIRLGFLLAVILALHNLPEGLAVAASNLADNELGFLMTVAIAIHNIPEGLCVACPIYSATGSVWEATKLATLSGLTEPIGALMALFVFSGVNDNGLLEVILNYVLVFVGGVMLSVSIRELIPEAIASGHVESMKKGFVGGALVMGITMYVL